MAESAAVRPAGAAGGSHAYDLFVVHAEADRPWVHGYLLPALALSSGRVLTTDDFRLGVPVVDEVERAVTTSRFTVVVLTGAFGSDEWSTFGEQLASHAAAAGGGSRIIPLVLEPSELPLRIEFRVRLDCTDQDRWEAEVDRLRALLDQPTPAVEEVACPYPGMVPFASGDERFFHGREDEIEDLVLRLRHERLLVVIGPSGSGKSSLVFAGVLPALARGHGSDWVVRSLRPGASPVASLVQTLQPEAERNAEEPAAAVLAAALAATAGPAGRLLLVVDQLEEVFALATSEDRAAFFSALVQLRAVDGLSLLITVRADFYTELMASPLWPLGAGERVEVTPLRGDALRRAIERPAAVVGVHLEPGLVQRLLADAADEPGVLPLLQETMVMLWEQRRRRLLTLASYEALGSDGRSGLEVALATKADATLASLTGDEQTVARRIFLRLVQLGQGRDDTRRQQPVSALRAAAEDPRLFDATLGPLASHRLLTLSGGEHGTGVGVDIAHEALIESWPTLRRWVDQDRVWLRVREELAGDAKEWEALERDAGALYRGARLVTAAEHAAEHADELNASERAFLDASQAQATAEEESRRRSHRRLRRLTTSLAGILALALVATAIAVDRTATARAEARLADSRRLAAQAVAGLGQLDRALLTSMEAVRTADTVEARSALLAALQRSPRLVTFLRPEAGALAGVAFSADGRVLATAGGNDTILLWEVAGGRVTGTLRGDGVGTSVAFSPDGRTLASGDREGSVALWDVESGRRLRTRPAGHQAAVTSLDFSPDGRTLASSSHDKDVALWDVGTGNLVGAPLEGHGDRVSSATFSADGRWLATASLDRKVIVWDVASRRPVTTLTAADGVAAVAFSPDAGTVAAAGHDATVTRWDVTSGQPAGEPLVGHGGAVTSVAFIDDTTLVTGDDGGTILLWDVEGPEPSVSALHGHRAGVTGIATSPDGTTLASASADGTVALWRPDDRHPLGTPVVNGPEKVVSVATGPDGAALASGNEDGTMYLSEPGGRRRKLSHVHADAVTGLAFSPDGATLASAGADGTVVLSDVASGRTRGGPVRSGRAILAIAFSPDGATLAAGGRDGTIELWDVQSRRLRRSFPVRGGLSALAFTPDGRSLVSAALTGLDGTVTVWDLSARTPKGRLLAGPEPTRSLALSPDGRIVALGGLKGAVTMTDLATGRRLAGLPGHEQMVRGLAFSADGRTLASGGADGTVRLWDVATRQALGAALRGHLDQVTGVAFSPDGASLASGSFDGTVVRWDLRLSSWLDRACLVANRNLSRAEWEQVVGPGTSYRRTCAEAAGPAKGDG